MTKHTIKPMATPHRIFHHHKAGAKGLSRPAISLTLLTLLSLLLAFNFYPAAVSAASTAGSPAAAVYANPTVSEVTVNGGAFAVDAFNISNYNYFKLRALAAAVNCGVRYDNVSDTIYIDVSEPYDYSVSYTDIGGNGAGDGASGGPRAALRTTSSVMLNGEQALFEAYNIGGFNYFKLRDFLQAVDCGVWYDSGADVINIETDKSYNPDYQGPNGNTGGAGNGSTGNTGTGRRARRGDSGGTDIATGEVPLGPAGTTGDVPLGPAGTTDAADAAAQIALEFRNRVVELVNDERAAVGRAPLAAHDVLFEIAQYKCDDMVEYDYFEHISPSYGDPEVLFDMYGLDYRQMGENIAMGQTTPEQAIEGWMNSPGHRENILNENYEYIGVGFAINASGRTLWTQVFLQLP